MAELLYWIALHCTGVSNKVANECRHIAPLYYQLTIQQKLITFIKNQ